MPKSINYSLKGDNIFLRSNQSKTELNKRLKYDFEKQFKEIFNEYEESIPNQLENRLYQIIRYTIERHDWYEDQRFRFLQIALSLIGFAGTLTVIALTYSEKIQTLDYISTLLLEIIIFDILIMGIIILILYCSLLSPEYPLVKNIDRTTWYPIHTYKSKFSFFQKFNEKQENNWNDINTYIQIWKSISNEKNGFIKDNLKQIFMLHLLKKYKRDNLKSMIKILGIGVIIFSIALLSLLINLFIRL